MKTIYIDSDFRCHAENDGTMTAVETDIFDGKCDEYLEGYRFVPAGQSWTREDGVTFRGEMVTLRKPWWLLDADQRDYERALLAEYEQALREIEMALGVRE